MMYFPQSKWHNDQCSRVRCLFSLIQVSLFLKWCRIVFFLTAGDASFNSNRSLFSEKQKLKLKGSDLGEKWTAPPGLSMKNHLFKLNLRTHVWLMWTFFLQWRAGRLGLCWRSESKSKNQWKALTHSLAHRFLSSIHHQLAASLHLFCLHTEDAPQFEALWAADWRFLLWKQPQVKKHCIEGYWG